MRSAIGDEKFKEAKRIETFEVGPFEFYRALLPLPRYRGLINQWFFGILLESEQYIADNEIELVISQARQLIRNALLEKQTPLLIVSDCSNIRMVDNLKYDQRTVFFLDKHHLPGTKNIPKNPRLAPFIKAVRRKIEQERISASLFAPYNPDEPAVGWRFFGRTKEIDRLVNSSESYFVAGVRKIGKTSLLKEAQQRLEERGDHVFYVSVQHLDHLHEVVPAIVKTLSERDAHRAVRRSRAFDESLLESVLKSISSRRGPVTLIMDEFGNVLAKNRKEDWQVIGLLRDFVHSGRLRLIMSGFQELFIKQYQDFEGPYYNFVGYLKLRPFTDREIIELIVEPLRIWGTVRDNTSLLNLLTGQVGRQPYLLQHVGRALFVDMLQRGGQDAQSLLESYLSGNGLKHFSQPVNTLFDNIKVSTERFLFLERCREAERNGEPLHAAEITDQWIRKTFEKKGYKSSYDGRRFLLESMELHGFTTPVDVSASRQRIAVPIFYTFKKETEPDLDNLIETLAEEVAVEKNRLEI